MKLELLNAINNQCAVAQRSIAQNFGSSDDERMVKELLVLLELLQKYFSG